MKSSWPEGKKEIALTFQLNENIAVSMVAGYSPAPRTALWNITLIDGSAYEIDFILKAITFSGDDNKLPTKKHKGDKSTISKILSSVFVATAPCLIIDYLTLYESLLIAND